MKTIIQSCTLEIVDAYHDREVATSHIDVHFITQAVCRAYSLEEDSRLKFYYKIGARFPFSTKVDHIALKETWRSITC